MYKDWRCIRYSSFIVSIIEIFAIFHIFLLYDLFYFQPVIGKPPDAQNEILYSLWKLQFLI